MDNITILNDIRENLPPVFTSHEASLILSKKYRFPGKALESMTKKGQLLRLKRNMYILQENYDPILVAGSLHQPSYISFETALSYYGIIPERTEAVISVSDARTYQILSNGVYYHYRSQARLLYSEGMTCVKINNQIIYLATKEKALFDTLAYYRLNTKNLMPNDILKYVLNSMRIEENVLYSMSKKKLARLASLYRNKAPQLLLDALVNHKSAKR